MNSFLIEIYLYSEYTRLRSFTHENWKCDSNISVDELARFGFYYLKRGDSVACAFCDVRLCQFENGDNALSEHIKWSPNCPLIRRRATNNIPICPHKLDRELPPASHDICGGVLENQFGRMELLSHRLQTFDVWPIGLHQRPEELARAGFIYTKCGDIVKCFMCNIVLGHWEPNDDPWEEHKKHTESCAFVDLNYKPTTHKTNAETKSNVPTKAFPRTDESTTEVPDELLCKICLFNRTSLIFLPCEHLVSCGQCFLGLNNKCPICRAVISSHIVLNYS